MKECDYYKVIPQESSSHFFWYIEVEKGTKHVLRDISVWFIDGFIEREVVDLSFYNYRGCDIFPINLTSDKFNTMWILARDKFITLK